ncbi:MAG: hypothetical protein NC314_00555 [Roseburia sp.]|nr:hypothetical protein [Ruminococcus sp.]MCM1154177.1 hypothetical protein [Roseburia sp.]MCM1241303.1 hypothetical protein [Roseburia sp.]
MSRHDDFEDDGRTIADMSGIGPAHASWFGRRSPSSGEEERSQEENRRERPWEESPFTWKERFRYMGVALGAALSIALAFLAGIALIIWLITLYAK